MKGYCLRNIPADVYKIILDQQNEEKKLRGTNQFSFQATLFKIVREFEKCKQAGHQTNLPK